MADFTIPYYGSNPHPVQYEPYPAQYEPYGVLYYDASPDYEPPSYSAIMAASCPKVQALYKEIIAKEKEYEAWKWPYTSSYSSHEEEGIIAGTAHRTNRLQIEGDFLALALTVKKLYQGKARGAEHLRERICDIMADVDRAIRDDLTFLEKCLDDERKQQTSGEQFGMVADITTSCSRDEYSRLAIRVDQFASMRKTFERSYFTLSNGKVCSLPGNLITLKNKLHSIERKLPDSEFVQGFKSFVRGVRDLFTPAPTPSYGSASYHPSTEANSAYTKSMERIINLQVQQSQIYQGWERVQTVNRGW